MATYTCYQCTTGYLNIDHLLYSYAGERRRLLKLNVSKKFKGADKTPLKVLIKVGILHESYECGDDVQYLCVECTSILRKVIALLDFKLR